MAQHLPQAPASCFSELRILSSAKFHTYQAFDTNLDHQVVLKVFPLAASAQPKYQNEKAHLLTLQHQNVIRLLQAVDMAPAPANSHEELASYLVLEHAMYGDLLEVVTKCGRMAEDLARTIFHHLVDALSYLHSRNIAHLDIKMENLLLSSNYELKLADFDLSQTLDSSILEGKGTAGYRAPEVREGFCNDFKAADLYSTGIILFILVAGHSPYSEVESGVGPTYDKLYKFFRNSNQRFWESHARFAGNSKLFTEQFKTLINQIMAEKPEERPTIEDLKNTCWYQGTVLTEEEYIRAMRKYMKH